MRKPNLKLVNDIGWLNEPSLTSLFFLI